jgi:hypothetical protein
MRRRSSALLLAGLLLAPVGAAQAQVLGEPGAASLFGPEGSKVLSAPTDAEVAAAPAGRKAEGSAVIHCAVAPDGRLAACEKTLERGSGGLAEALISLAPKFRIEIPKDTPPGEDVAVATATWPVPDTAADWQVKPKPGDFATTWTDAAWHSDRPGYTVTNCLVGKLGTTYRCVVIYQTPPGKGFGTMVLRLASYLKLKPAQIAGKPVDSAANVIFRMEAHTPGKAEKNPF